MKRAWFLTMFMLSVSGVCLAQQATTSAAATLPADPLAGYIKPADWLKQQPKPKFKEGHTLPPLTRYGWCLDFDTRVEFAEKWGYCLEFAGGYLTHAVVDRVLGNPNDPEAKILALAAKDPKTYKLVVITSREMPPKDKLPPETWCRDADGKLLTGQAKSQDGNAWTPGVEAQWSPAAPVSVWEEVARLRAEPLRRLREKFPIAIVLNGGEEGIPVAGWGWKLWEKDPAICNDNVSIRKVVGREITWAEYGSARMGRMQALIADAIRKAVPDRTLYVYYALGGNAGPWDWAPGYKDMKPSSDLPGPQCYFMDHNSGWSGGQDMLTKFLEAKAYEIAGGQPLSYNWLCGGYKEPKPGNQVSDIPRYMGFLRCAYTGGMIGGNGGYYTYPRYSAPYPKNTGGFDVKFPPNEPPNWIEQLVALGRVHAQFSHLEHYLRQGDLLPGPAKLRGSKDMPAYEFPTGDANARVVVRKLKAKPQWLITAWAADGKEREVKVTVPELGEVALKATAEANVYDATLKDGKPVVMPVANQ